MLKVPEIGMFCGSAEELKDFKYVGTAVGSVELGKEGRAKFFALALTASLKSLQTGRAFGMYAADPPAARERMKEAYISCIVL
jgi:hypothetical protein